MSQDIKISNPNDPVFGALSPFYPQEIRAGSVSYPTPANFIFSNMLNTPMYKLALKNAKVKGVGKNIDVEEKVKEIVAKIRITQKRYPGSKEIVQIRNTLETQLSFQKQDLTQLYNFYFEKEYNDTLERAILKALSAKIVQYPELKEVLLNTGQSPIYYESSNSRLGTGEDKNGLNILGRCIMQVRHQVKMEIQAQNASKMYVKKDEELYDAYKVYNILTFKILQYEPIDEYYGELNNKKILHELVDEKHSLEYYGINDASKDSIISMLKKGYMPELNTKQPMANLVYENNITALKNKKLNLEKKIIYDRYVKTVFPNLDNELEPPAVLDYVNVLDRLYNLYIAGHLDDELTAKIQKKLSKLPSLISAPGENKLEKILSDSSSDEEEKEERHHKPKKMYHVYALTKGGRKIPIYESEEKPEDLERIFKKYNKKHGTSYKASRSLVERKRAKPSVSLLQRNEPIEDFPEIIQTEGEYIKSMGVPYIIEPDEKSDLKYFTPLYMQNFVVDELDYPSLSMYISTVRLASINYEKDIKRIPMFTRGISVAKARNMLMKGNSFVPQSEADKILFENNTKLEQLFNIYCEFAMRKKFENPSMIELLILTKSKRLIYPQFPIMDSLVEDIRMNALISYQEKPPVQGNVGEFLMSDPILSPWVKARALDMIETVNKCQTFLNDCQSDYTQAQDATPDFIRVVLNSVYGDVKNDYNGKTPASFVSFVGLHQQPPTNKSLQAKAVLENVKMLLDIEFWGVSSDMNVYKKYIDLISQKKYEQVLEMDNKDTVKYYKLFKAGGASKEKLKALIGNKNVDDFIQDMEKYYTDTEGIVRDDSIVSDSIEARSKVRRTPEERKAHDQLIAKLNGEIILLNENAKKYKVGNESIILNNASVYFNHVLNILNINIDTETLSIRKRLIKFEQGLIEAKCDAPFSSCTEAALMNVFKSVIKFWKHYYADGINVDKRALDLAYCILANKSYKVKHNVEAVQNVIEVDGIVGQDEEVNDDLVEEEAIDNVEQDIDEDDFGADFGMGKVGVKYQTIRNALYSVLGNVGNLDEMTNYFIELVENIENGDLPYNVKVLRVNYFSSS